MIGRIAIPLTLLMLAACSSGGDVDTTAAEGADTALETVEADAADADIEENELTVPDDGTSTTTATTPVSTVADSTTSSTVADIAPIEPLINDAPLISTRTPAVVDILRPVLEWEPIDGADSYSVMVLDETGVPYWAWSGPGSEITLGGAPSSDFGIGPIIGIDYSWSVAAFAADGKFLAISGQVPISTE